MRSLTAATLAACALFALSTPVSAGPPAKAASCMGCHNPAKASPTNPRLCGQPKQYLMDATKAYKSGGRNNPTMKALVMTLGDPDIDSVAGWYSSQACK